MISEGLNLHDFQTIAELYRSCPYCMVQIDFEYKPVLLTCGHIVCVECANERCCGECGCARDIKKNPFSTLLKYWQMLDA